MVLFLIIENASLATYPDACAACMMYTTVPATVGSYDGRVVRASASGAVDSGLILSLAKPITLKLEFTAFLLNAQQ